jgi:soluble lytic murein transglycosylase
MVRQLLAGLLMVFVYGFACAFDPNNQELVRAVSKSESISWNMLESQYLAKASAADKHVVKAIHMLNNANQYTIEEIIKIYGDNSWISGGILRARVQESLHTRKPSEKVKWFKQQPPKGHQYSLMYLDARFELNNKLIKQKEFRSEIRRHWRNSVLDKPSEAFYLKRYGKYFSEYDYRVKMAELLWAQKTTQAERLLRHISTKKYRLLYKHRINIARSPYRFSKLPASYQQDDFIRYTYIRKLLKKEHPKALNMLAQYNPTRRLDKWSNLQQIAARDALRAKKYTLALQILERNKVDKGGKYYDTEWLKGWIFLRCKKQPEQAIKHFFRAYNTAKMSYSQSKAAYWLGRTFKQLGNKEKRDKWFNIAGKHTNTFYGQLSYHELGKDPTTRIYASNDNSRDIESLPADRRYRAQIATLLYKGKQDRLAYALFDNLNMSETERDSSKILAAYFAEKKVFPFAVLVAKQTANRGQGVIKEGYPTDIIFPESNNNQALYLSLIRQESNFDQQAISSAGAVGLMQLMPFIAKEYAKILKLPHDAYIYDANANAAKGSTHMDGLMKRYDKTYITAIAAYNSSEGAANKWIKRNGNPKKFHHPYSSIDWIEMISYGETRFYVTKVLENLTIYDYLLSSKRSNINDYLIAKK